MDSKEKHILITVPSLQDLGGVASYYNSISSHLSSSSAGKLNISTLEIGNTRGHGNRMYPITDQLRFFRTITKFKPNLVHVNPSLDLKSFIRDGLFILQAKLKRLPVIVFFHGWQNDFEKLVQNRLLWFFKLTYGRADSFIVLATEFKKMLQQWGITQPIYLETTTVDESLLDKFSISDKLAQFKKAKTIKILFLARLERKKGIFETIDAVAKLIQKGLPVSLSIAGDGKITGELQHYVQKQKIPKSNICFLGYVKNSDKITAFTDHHIYCFPTCFPEGLPTSVLEAMAFGMPVITRAVGGLADIFIDGKMGAIVQGKSPEEIAFCLEKIINNKQKMIEIGRYNAEYAKKHFLAPVVAKRLLKIYDTMIA